MCTSAAIVGVGAQAPGAVAMGAGVRNQRHGFSDIARAFRAAARPAQPVPPALFHWGPFEVRARIGCGGFAEVFQAWDPLLKRNIALKLHRRDALDAAQSNVLDEARRLACLEHPHLPRVYGAAIHAGRAGLWTELIDGMNLAERVASSGPLSEAAALRTTGEVASALAAVHGAGFVHGDIKAANVMQRCDGRTVLIDFGSASPRDENRVIVQLSGTPRWLAPEVLQGALPSVASDIYALGALALFLLSGDAPLDPAQAALQAPRGMKRRYLRNGPHNGDAGTRALIERCLDPDCTRRPRDAGELSAALAGLLQRLQRKAGNRRRS